MNEIRVAPDGKSVAIRTEFPAGGPTEYGVMTSANGGHYASAEDVADWQPLSEPEPEPEPESAEPVKTAAKGKRPRATADGAEA